MLSTPRHNKAEYPGLLVAFLASGIFHCVLIAILATTAIYYPLVNSSSERFDFNFIWANLAPGSENPVESPQSSTVGPVPEPPEAPTEKVASQTEDAEEFDDEPAPVSSRQDGEEDAVLTTIKTKKPRKAPAEKQRVPEVPVTSQVPKTVAKTVAPSPIKPPDPGLPLTDPVVGEAKQSVKTTENETISEPVAKMTTVSKPELEAQQAAHEKALRLEAEKEAALRVQAAEQLQRAEAARKAELERQLREKAAREKAAAEQLAREKAARERLAAEQLALQKEAEEKSRRERAARLKAESEQREKEKLALARAAEEKAAKLKADLARPVPPSSPPLSREPARPVAGNAAGASVPARVSNSVPSKAVPAAVPSGSATVEPKQPLKQENTAGITLPPIKGDIKLAVYAEDDLTIKVLFIDYPKGKHSRPMTRSEAKALQKLTPIVVRSSKNTLEAVLERAREGIYLFLVEQEGGKPVDGKFSLKLFDTHVRQLAGRKVSGETEVARLMMPEGILWDDDSSFTGNMEDSDSVTKFNSDTGMVWKMYRK